MIQVNYISFYQGLGITDNYAKNAILKDLTLEQFFEIAHKIRGIDKDTYNKEILA